MSYRQQLKMAALFIKMRMKKKKKLGRQGLLATASGQCNICFFFQVKQYWPDYLRDSAIIYLPGLCQICLGCARKSPVTQQHAVGREENVNKKTCLQSGSAVLSPKNTHKLPQHSACINTVKYKVLTKQM